MSHSVEELLKMLAEAKAKQGFTDSQSKKLETLTKSATTVAKKEVKVEPKSTTTTTKKSRQLPKFFREPAK
jgi:hypothetical protein